jgi:hypothetical protein
MKTQNNGVATTGRIRLEFKNEWPLDTFCVTCLQNGVPFAYGAGLSISMPKQAFQQLPPPVRIQLKQYKELGEVSSKDDPLPSQKRRVVTAEESREVLQKLIPEKYLPK